MKRRDDPSGLDLFDRSEAAWRALGAPTWMFDVPAGAAMAARVASWGFRLDAGFMDEPAARALWRLTRPAFLARAGALTPAERAAVAQSPRVHNVSEAEAHYSWRAGVTTGDVLDGLVPPEPEVMPTWW